MPVSRLDACRMRLRQQGIERALSLLHRRVGRGLQAIDDREYRLRECLRAETQFCRGGVE